MKYGEFQIAPVADESMWRPGPNKLAKAIARSLDEPRRVRGWVDIDPNYPYAARPAGFIGHDLLFTVYTFVGGEFLKVDGKGE